MENNNYNSNEPNNFQTPNPPYNTQYTAPLSLGQYLGMMLLMLIPLVNIILLLIWSFGDYNVNKKNYARASLIMLIIAIVLWIISGVAFMGLIMQDPNFNNLTI